MATEQWEIELRRQLGKEIPRIENTPIIIEKKASSFISESLIMMFLLVVLGITLLFAYDYKTDGQIQKLLYSLFTPVMSAKQNESPIEPLPPKPDSQIESIIALKEDIQKSKLTLDGLSSQMRANEEKISLIGIVLNENFLVIRNNLPKDNMIFFNRDWTIDKMPKNITLTEEDKAYLNKFIKPQ